MPTLHVRKDPHRAEKPKPIKTIHKLVDQLLEVAQKYGDNPPVVVVRTRFGYERYVIVKVEVCGAVDHTLIFVEAEQ